MSAASTWLVVTQWACACASFFALFLAWIEWDVRGRRSLWKCVELVVLSVLLGLAVVALHRP